MFARNAEKKMSDKPQKKNAASRYGFLPDVEYLENYFALFDTFDADAQKSMPYRLEGLMFVATVCGTCHFTVDLKEHILHPNELLLVLPGQMVQHVDKSADFQGRFMFMSSELLANISTRKKNFSVFFALRDNPGSCWAWGWWRLFWYSWPRKTIIGKPILLPIRRPARPDFGSRSIFASSP